MRRGGATHPGAGGRPRLPRQSARADPAGRKVFLILDNLNVHKAKKVRAWLDERSEQIEVFFLPPYSPELNPDEYLNGDLKRSVHQDIPPRNAVELRSTATKHLRAIQRSRRRVQRYFAHPSIRYAA